ncbi:MAG: hypothetical protein K9W44_10875 [Candidatus Lokiarchaeota archaeon]|nr:hypothetical protein [Candidatus Harpocratesius repetitus]
MEEYLQNFERHYNQIRKFILNGKSGIRINGLRIEALLIGFIYLLFSRSQVSQNFAIEFTNKIIEKNKQNPIFFGNQTIINQQEIFSFFIPEMTRIASLSGIHNTILVELNFPIFLADDPIFQTIVPEGAIYMLPLDFKNILVFSITSLAEKDKSKVLLRYLEKLYQNFPYQWYLDKQYNIAHRFIICNSEKQMKNYLSQ